MRGADKEGGSPRRVEGPTRSRPGPTMWLLACGLAMGASGTAFAGSQGGYSDAELVSAALEVYNDSATMPLPYLDTHQLERLTKHDIVRIRKSIPPSKDDDGHREEVVGMRIIEEPRRKVWLAALDPNFDASDLLTEVRLEQHEDGSSLWFQYLSLPWPIADRYWVIHLFKDLELDRVTKDFVWEHGWDLAKDGPEIARRTVASGRAGKLTTKDLESAVYVPFNRGAWILFALDVNRTLLAYRVSADVGGSIPESWIATFAMAQLDGLLNRVTEHAKVAWRSYDPKRYPIYDGAGHVIPASDP